MVVRGAWTTVFIVLSLLASTTVLLRDSLLPALDMDQFEQTHSITVDDESVFQLIGGA